MAMDSFEYNSNHQKVLFGNGSLKQLPEEISRLRKSKPLILASQRQLDQIPHFNDLLGDKIVGSFKNAKMHTPVEMTETALDYAKSVGADVIVSIGGGSTIGLGKAISIRTGLPHICIPTTYSGSEMTPILGETASGKKTTRTDPKILPDVVIYDVDLTMSLSSHMTSVSGVNAIAHAVEALYARNTNPIIKLLAKEGVAALAKSLVELVQDPSSAPARYSALYGAWLCGTCLGGVGMSLHHKLCHTLGGSFNLPHAETHTIVLPHALSYNAPKVSEAMAALSDVLPGSEGDAIRGLNNLVSRLKVERGLKAYGMKESDVDKATDIAMSNPYWNPRDIERKPIRELIRRAWAGEEARSDS